MGHTLELTAQEIVALDLFAGTGWGVACKRLGIKEKGVELMAEAVATRLANGMETIYRDVWDGLLLSRSEHARLYGLYTLLIASPPCQTFSVAGHGAGRKALEEVIEAIQLHAYKNPELLLEFGKKHDIRTALVLSPLAYIYRDMPQYVALEQVPTVLPVWEAYAEVMRDLGYSVQTAILNSEQYGVPQTRRRAILVARLDGPVSLPVPTHSRYHPRDPKKLDPGVLKWVSMAEALGWGRHVPAPTYCNSGHGGAGIEWGGNSVRKAMREQSITGQDWTPKQGVEPGTNDAIRVSVEDAAAIQSYPVAATKIQTKGRVDKYGDRPDRSADAPAFTVVGHDGHPRGGFQFKNEDGTTRRATIEELAALQTYPQELRPEIENWKWKDAPATTVAGDPRITAREHHYHGEQNSTSLRITVEEASTLQSFPNGLVGFPSLTDNEDRVEIDGKAYRARDLRDADHPSQMVTEKARSWKHFTADSNKPLSIEDAGTIQTYEQPFVWCGSKTKQFLQIGNAVPPLMAQAILTALIAQPKPRRRRIARKLL